MCVGYGFNNLLVLIYVNVFCCGLLLLLMVLLFVVVLRKVLKWLKWFVGVIFGFGGKFVLFVFKKVVVGVVVVVFEVWNGDNVLFKDYVELGGFMFMK